MLDDDLLVHLISRHIFWYRRHAEINKAMFRMGSLTVILINGAITVVGYISGNLLITVLAVLVLVIRAAMELYCFHDNWKRYRVTLEKILVEVDIYLIKSKMHGKGALQDHKKHLVHRITEISSGEMKSWQKLRKKEKSKGDKQKT